MDGLLCDVTRVAHREEFHCYRCECDYGKHCFVFRQGVCIVNLILETCNQGRLGSSNFLAQIYCN